MEKYGRTFRPLRTWRLHALVFIAASSAHAIDFGFNPFENPDPEINTDSLVDTSKAAVRQEIPRSDQVDTLRPETQRDAGSGPRSNAEVIFTRARGQELAAIRRNGSEIQVQSYPVPAFGAWPSHLGIGYSHDDSGPQLKFQISQGYTLWYFGRQCFFRINYNGQYDFNTQAESGPIISRHQNPSLFFEFDFPSRRHGLLFGWAHESNGQFLQDSSDAATFSQVNNDRGGYRTQDFASMGWDYYWLHYAYQSSVFGFAAEYRFHIRQMSFYRTSGIEDTSFFDSKTHLGIKQVDGLRLQFQWRKAIQTQCVNTAMTWSIGLIFPEIGYGELSDFANPNHLPKFVELTLFKKVPMYASVTCGRMTRLSAFDDASGFVYRFGFLVPSIKNRGMDGLRFFRWLDGL